MGEAELPTEAVGRNGRVIGEELEVSKRGFDEGALSDIFVELLEERAEYHDAQSG